jgi:hypothetical protein
MLVFTMSLLFIVIPVVGLAIDGGVLYAARAKLQTATDGAALAAARSLSRGLTLSSQMASATQTAERFFTFNIHNGWLGLSSPTITVTFPAAPPKTTIVQVESAVQVPTYFMRVLGMESVIVRANGAANRRDVNIMLVLDRSGSLNTAGACDDLRSAARSFTENFVDGRDRLGLITFGTSYRVDFAPDFDFLTDTTPMTEMIDDIVCVGGTNSAAAYRQAYDRLKTINEPGTLNVILFFTDGQPNTLHMDALQIKGTSTCTDKTAKNGVVTPAGTSIWGIFQPYATAAPPAPNPDWIAVAGSSGCYYCCSNSKWSQVTNDVVSLAPSGASNEKDAWGNSLTGWKTDLDRDGSGRLMLNAKTVTNAGINALDNAAAYVRNDSTAVGLDVVTYSIGLGGPGQAEDALLRRIANVPESTIYDATKPTGMYVYAADASQLQAAFAQLASDILRLSM